MSAVTEADHEEITDTLLAARERIEHLTICGAALQAENGRLKAVIDALAASLRDCVEDSEQAALDYSQRYGFNHRPERLQAMWETVKQARAALAKAGELK